ncbi:MAG: VOC family protein [Candidatus Eisenbacteria bacterium]|nr:VOC family protein [Candidatus Eisenbacteria bacterium]
MTQPIREGFHSLTPHLIVRGAADAIDYYKKAFGAEERGRMPSPDGKAIWHAELRIGDSVLMLNDEFPDMGAVSPLTNGGSGVTLHLYVPDADAVFERAVQAGGKVRMPLADQFWGDRYGVIVDPFGHTWAIATHKEDPTEEQIRERVSKMTR